MRESEVRDYLRDTERGIYAVENRLDNLHELQLRTLIRRRSHNAGVAWHASTTAAGVLFVRREIKRQREQLRELRSEAEAARDRLEEMERQREQEDAEKERQREERRREEERRQAELEAELEAERARAEEEAQRAQEERQRAFELAQALDLERARVAELTQDLEEEREARERGGGEPTPEAEDDFDPDFKVTGTWDPEEDGPNPNGDDPGDRGGPDPAGVAVERGPRGPEPDSGGGAAEPPARERGDDAHEEHADDEYEREM